MAVPVIRRRAEGRVLKPFIGTAGLEKILAETLLRLTTAQDERTYSLNEVTSRPGRLLTTAGIRIELQVGPGDLLAAAELVGVSTEDLSLVVMVRDSGRSPLKETILLSATPLAALEGPVVVAGFNELNRPRPLRNRFDGFSILTQIVLTKALDPVPLRPYIKGTILAGATWTVTSTDSRSGLQPRPLTEEVRTRLVLPSAVWFYVEKIDSYLEAATLQEAFTVYVDEGYLRNMAFLSGSARQMAEHAIIVPALVSVALEASRELQTLPDDANDIGQSDSAVLAFLHEKTVRVSGEHLDFPDFIEMLRDESDRVVGMVSGANNIRSKMLKSSEDLAGGSDDLSDS